MTILEIVIAFFVLSGSGFILIAAIGIIRLPDVFCRSHALGKGMTLGITLILLGLWLHLGLDEAGIKVPLAIFFQFATIPVAGHLLSLLAYKKKIPFFTPRNPDKTR
jgi:multicomponent Na+:H+ antiporter subunit G